MRSEQATSASNENAVGRRMDDPPVVELRPRDDFGQFQRATIMMVDDEPVMLEMVQTFLGVTGHRKFIKVRHAGEALEKVREHRPDVLLLGVALGASGIEILKTLRADSNFIHLPVLILASSADTTTKLQAMEFGVTDLLSKPVDPIELAFRVRNALAADAYHDQFCHFDGLTGLPSRELFHDRVDWAIARAKRERTKLALLHVRFDDFKRLADSLGPRVSNDVLKQLVKRLTSRFRVSDAISRDVSGDEARAGVFRLGRADFSVLLPVVESVAGAAAVGQRILAAMSEPLNAEGTGVCLKPSIGIAGFPDDADDATALINLATGASNQASVQGGGRLQFFSSAMNHASRQWLRMEQDLRCAVEAGELRLLYQPKIDVSTGAVVGAEALMRWPRSDGVIVPPSDFIAVAEETAMILPIGEWTLREACRQAVQWRDQGVDIKIAVNISAPQFFEAKFARLVRSILEETGLGPGVLTLEITESIVIHRVRQALTIFGDLHAIGVDISIDDFGTGFSSLSYLKRFQANEVKIDKTLIADVVTSHENRALVCAVTYLAHQFGFRACAEGVEDAGQLKFLQKIKCDQYQGFLFNRPLDPRTFVSQYLERQGKILTGGE